MLKRSDGKAQAAIARPLLPRSFLWRIFVFPWACWSRPYGMVLLIAPPRFQNNHLRSRARRLVQGSTALGAEPSVWRSQIDREGGIPSPNWGESESAEFRKGQTSNPSGTRTINIVPSEKLSNGRREISSFEGAAKRRPGFGISLRRAYRAARAASPASLPA